MDEELLDDLLRSYGEDEDGDVAVAAPPEVKYRFRVGDRETGARETLAPDPEPEAEPLPEKVEKPENSRFIRGGRDLSFDEMMREDNEEFERKKSAIEEAVMSNPRVQVALGGIIMVVVLVLLYMGVNYLSGGSLTSAPTPGPTPGDKGAQSSATAEGTWPAPFPTSESDTAGVSCDGIQYYHSPDTSDVGPCVSQDERVVPTGKYGDDGVWLFMILANGETKWVKADSYGYTADQVIAMELKNYKANEPISAAPGGGAPIVEEAGGGDGGPAIMPGDDGPVLAPAEVQPEPTVAQDGKNVEAMETAKKFATANPVPTPTPRGVQINPIHGRPSVGSKSGEDGDSGAVNGIGSGVGGRP